MIYLLTVTAALFALWLTLALRTVLRLVFGVRPGREAIKVLTAVTIATLLLIAVYLIALYAQM